MPLGLAMDVEMQPKQELGIESKKVAFPERTLGR
jgi:hypothetical protein